MVPIVSIETAFLLEPTLSAVKEEPVLASDDPSGRKDTAAVAVLGPAE